MKKFLLLLTSFIVIVCYAQEHSLEKKWETDTLLKTPESVLFYKKGKFLFVSNINGKPNEKDGNGSIGKVGLEGKIINVNWVSGLNAPKGMGIYKNNLYVADINEVVVIDINKGTIIKKILVDSAVFLNDIAIDENGIVYVSDTRTFKVHKIENNIVSIFLNKLSGPNGLYCDDNTVFVLDKGSLLKVGSNQKITKIADGMDPSTDGIEMINDNEFVISSWAGIVYYVKVDGTKQTLFDNRDKKINSADIGYNPKSKIIYVPTFYGNKVVAYQLK
jgi:hypothetical protein